MPMLGQASGGWTEGSSALRLLHVGKRNSTGVLTVDSFTQTNPPGVTTANTISTQVDQTRQGVLGGSVAFARPDAGSNFIGGPGLAATQVLIAAAAAQAIGYKALGVFVNGANGNAFENTPGTASGKNTYVSSQGTYANGLFETALIGAAAVDPAGTAITYIVGMELIASRNGYLMPARNISLGGVLTNLDIVTCAAESFVAGAASSSTILGILKMPADSVQNEILYDQRI